MSPTAFKEMKDLEIVHYRTFGKIYMVLLLFICKYISGSIGVVQLEVDYVTCELEFQLDTISEYATQWSTFF